jgi:hypothetical protein
MLPKEVTACLLVLQYIFEEQLQDIFPDMTVALRIFLSMPVAMAS